MKRLSQGDYFLSMALLASERSNCYRRRVGCVLVDKNNRVLSTGYNGVPRGVKHCEVGACPRDNKPSGSNLNKCYAIHAEQNALLSCPDIDKIHKAYITTSPCITCTVMLMNTSCKEVIFIEAYPGWEESRDLWINSERIWTHAAAPTIRG